MVVKILTVSFQAFRPQDVDRDFKKSLKKFSQLSLQMDDLAFNKALVTIWEIVNAGNNISMKQPRGPWQV